MACNDAGIGKNQAGTAGLAALDSSGIAGIGVGHDTARIGDGLDTWESGRVSFVNARAHGWASGSAGRSRSSWPCSSHGKETPMFRDVVWSDGGVDIVVMDSMSQTTDGDRGAIVVAGSNGGQESGRVGVHAGCAFVLLERRRHRQGPGRSRRAGRPRGRRHPRSNGQS
ncbi:hypothetical protein [Aeromicrobium sp. UC242_57]|uniref:hypothetical protein n=1 Tax=Aeromicrobium sp. UC242_57 TaxID=3374624 RepID=UPI0037A4F5FF